MGTGLRRRASGNVVCIPYACSLTPDALLTDINYPVVDKDKNYRYQG